MSKPPNHTPEYDRAAVSNACWRVYLNAGTLISIGIGPCWLPLFTGTAAELTKSLEETIANFDPAQEYKYRYWAEGYTEPIPLDDGSEIQDARARSAIDEVVLACEPVIMSKRFFGNLHVEWQLDPEEAGVKSCRFHYKVSIFDNE